MQWRCSVIHRLHRKVQNTHTWQSAPHRWYANDSALNVSKGWSWTIHLWPGIKGYHVCHNVVQPSVIIRAVVNKLARGSRISRNNRHALKEFSMDIINCLAIMHGLHYCADVNANELLRRIVFGLPDHRIDKWKGTVADIRERDHVRTLQHICHFTRKLVRVEFDPDLGDM